MKKLSIFILIMTILLSFGATSWAGELEIHGELINDLIIEESENNADKKYFKNLDKNNLLTGNIFNLILEKELGFEGNVYLKTQFSKKYNGEKVAQIRQGYLDYYTKNADFRIGKQMIRWGTGYRFKPNDVFNPNDMTGLKEYFDRLAINAVKMNYYFPNRSELAFVFTPEAKPQKLKEEKIDSIFSQTKMEVGSQTYAQLMQNPTFSNLKNLLASQNIDINQSTVQDWITPEIDEGENEVESGQIGLRFTKRGVKGFDYSFMLFRSRNKTFTLDQKSFAANLGEEIAEVGNEVTNYLNNGMRSKALDAIENHELPIKYIYPHATRIGFSTIGQLGNQNVWLDLNYIIYDEDRYQDGGYYVIGHDLKFANDLYITNQLTYAKPMREKDDDLITFNWIAEYPILQKHNLNVTTVYDITNDGFYIEPQFDYQLTKSAELQLGFTWRGAEETGDPMAALGQDRVYSRLKVNF